MDFSKHVISQSIIVGMVMFLFGDIYGTFIEGDSVSVLCNASQYNKVFRMGEREKNRG